MYKLSDPHDPDTDYYGNLLVSPSPANLQSLKAQKRFLLSKKYVLLGSAYESQENKQYAVKYYK